MLMFSSRKPWQKFGESDLETEFECSWGKIDNLRNKGNHMVDLLICVSRLFIIFMHQYQILSPEIKIIP